MRMDNWLKRKVKFKTAFLLIAPAMILIVGVASFVLLPGQNSHSSIDSIDSILADPDPPSVPTGNPAPEPVLSYEEKLAKCVPDRDPSQEPDPTPADKAEAAGARLYRAEDYEGASTAYEDCIRFDPARTQCIRELAVALSKSNRRARALACYSAYLETYSGTSEPPPL